LGWGLQSKEFPICPNPIVFYGEDTVDPNL